MSKTRYYVGWEIPEHVRSSLLVQFVPVHPDVIAHHITLIFNVGEDEPVPEQTSARVVGIASDHRVQALVVEIDGTTARPDGKTYHCTWSIDREKGAKPVMSNDLLVHGWEAVDPIEIEIVPRRFKMV